VTSLGSLHAGSLINLERAMQANGRFGGHLVLGHVDGTGTVQAIRPEAEFTWMTIGYPASLAAYLIHRGSIAVDGISLTVAKLDGGVLRLCRSCPSPGRIRICGRRAPAIAVNLECDMVGKYVVRALEQLSVRRS
jgi:riboflavin synthase